MQEKYNVGIYCRLSRDDEQSELKKQIQSLRVEIDRQGQQMNNLDRFIRIAGK